MDSGARQKDQRDGGAREGLENGATIDLACPAERCEEIALCESITIADYGLSPGAAHSGLCKADNYELKNRLFLRYLDTALKINRILDGV